MASELIELKPDQLKKKDHDEKILSGKSPERICNEAGTSFDACFGLSGPMKAARDLVLATPGAIPAPPEGGDLQWHQEHFLTDLYLTFAENRHSLRHSNSDLRGRDLDIAALRQTLQPLGIEPPDPEILDHYRSDRLLNIGDPFQTIGKLFEDPRVLTIDYEFAQEADDNRKRNRQQVVGQTIYNSSQSQSIIKELAETNQLSPELTPILLGQGDPESDDYQRGVADVLEELNYYSREYTAGNLTTGQARDAMDPLYGELNSLATKARLLDPGSKGKTPFRDNRDFTDSDSYYSLPELFRQIFYLQQDRHRLSTFQVYEESVFPEVLYRHIEDIMEMHFNRTRDTSDSMRLHYEALWETILREMGFDYKTYDPTHPDSRPFEVMKEFLDREGPSIIHSYDSEISKQLENEIQEKMNTQMPWRQETDESEALEMLFPFTQDFPSNSFDRILASWSFSTHMLAHWSDPQLENIIWPELDRLLSAEGVAIIFPIGFYDDYDHGTVELRIKETIARYRKKTGSNLKYGFIEPQDPATDGSSTLVLFRNEAPDYVYDIG